MKLEWNMVMDDHDCAEPGQESFRKYYNRLKKEPT